MAPNDFMLAIQEQNSAQLLRVPGIGKKTAERVLLELKEAKSLLPLAEQLKAHTAGGANLIEQINGTPSKLQVRTEVEQALTALGYSDKETTQACSNLPENCSTTEGLRLVLRQLSKP